FLLVLLRDFDGRTVCLFKDQQVITLSVRKVLDRSDFEIDGFQSTFVLDQHPVFTNRAVPFCFLKSDAQFQMQSGLDHSEQIQARIPWKWIEKRPRLADELDNLEVFVHDDAGRRIAIQEHLLPDFQQIRALCTIRGCSMIVFRMKPRHEIQCDMAVNALFCINLVLLVQRLENVGETYNSFRRPRNQNQTANQGKQQEALYV